MNIEGARPSPYPEVACGDGIGRHRHERNVPALNAVVSLQYRTASSSYHPKATIPSGPPVLTEAEHRLYRMQFRAAPASEVPHDHPVTKPIIVSCFNSKPRLQQSALSNLPRR